MRSLKLVIGACAMTQAQTLKESMGTLLDNLVGNLLCERVRKAARSHRTLDSVIDGKRDRYKSPARRNHCAAGMITYVTLDNCGGGGSRDEGRKVASSTRARRLTEVAAETSKDAAPYGKKKARLGRKKHTATKKKSAESAEQSQSERLENMSESVSSASESLSELPGQNNSIFRLLGDWPAVHSRQRLELDVPIQAQFDGHYPVGKEEPYLEHLGHRPSVTSLAEKRETERAWSDEYEKIRRAAECHRQVRRFAQSFIRPGLTTMEICQRLEQKTLELIEKNGLERGWGFPTGCSLNRVAAHYTPNYGDKVVLEYDDVCKLDFGVQVGGRIVDCAFTMAFNPKFDPLIEATREGTYTGIQMAGIDARFSEIGAAIQEVIESYEIELDGKIVQIKPVWNLGGHNMEPYRIHANKLVPIVKSKSRDRMEENEIYAIETFASTGTGYVDEVGDCSHYMKVFGNQRVHITHSGANKLLQHIEQNFGTLAFCRRWLDDTGQKGHIAALNKLVEHGLVEEFPPLCDRKGSYTSQLEHTIILRPTCKEVVSKGDDY